MDAAMNPGIGTSRSHSMDLITDAPDIAHPAQAQRVDILYIGSQSKTLLSPDNMDTDTKGLEGESEQEPQGIRVADIIEQDPEALKKRIGNLFTWYDPDKWPADEERHGDFPEIDQLDSEVIKKLLQVIDKKGEENPQAQHRTNNATNTPKHHDTVEELESLQYKRAMVKTAEEPHTFLAYINLNSAMTIKRTMLLIYRFLHPLQAPVLARNHPQELHPFYLTRAQRGSCKRMIDEAAGNPLLFNMLRWYSLYWKEKREVKVKAIAKEMKGWVSYPVRHPGLYPKEVQWIRVKWEKMRSDDVPLVILPGESTWEECRKIWEERTELQAERGGHEYSRSSIPGWDTEFKGDRATKTWWDWEFSEEEGTTTWDEDYPEEIDFKETSSESESEPETIRSSSPKKPFNIFHQTILPGEGRQTRRGTFFDASPANWKRPTKAEGDKPKWRRKVADYCEDSESEVEVKPKLETKPKAKSKGRTKWKIQPRTSALNPKPSILAPLKYQSSEDEDEDNSEAEGEADSEYCGDSEYENGQQFDSYSVADSDAETALDEKVSTTTKDSSRLKSATKPENPIPVGKKAKEKKGTRGGSGPSASWQLRPAEKLIVKLPLLPRDRMTRQRKESEETAAQMSRGSYTPELAKLKSVSPGRNPVGRKKEPEIMLSSKHDISSPEKPETKRRKTLVENKTAVSSPRKSESVLHPKKKQLAGEEEAEALSMSKRQNSSPNKQQESKRRKAIDGKKVPTSVPQESNSILSRDEKPVGPMDMSEHPRVRQTTLPDSRKSRLTAVSTSFDPKPKSSASQPKRVSSQTRMQRDSLQNVPSGPRSANPSESFNKSVPRVPSSSTPHRDVPSTQTPTPQRFKSIGNISPPRESILRSIETPSSKAKNKARTLTGQSQMLSTRASGRSGSDALSSRGPRTSPPKRLSNNTWAPGKPISSTLVPPGSSSRLSFPHSSKSKLSSAERSRSGAPSFQGPRDSARVIPRPRLDTSVPGESRAGTFVPTNMRSGSRASTPREARPSATSSPRHGPRPIASSLQRPHISTPFQKFQVFPSTSSSSEFRIGPRASVARPNFSTNTFHRPGTSTIAHRDPSFDNASQRPRSRSSPRGSAFNSRTATDPRARASTPTRQGAQWSPPSGSSRQASGMQGRLSAPPADGLSFRGRQSLGTNSSGSVSISNHRAPQDSPTTSVARESPRKQPWYRR